MSFKELKQQYEAIEKKKSDTSARCTPLIADFLALLFQGNARCLKYLGLTCWYSDKPDPDKYYKYAVHYLKAAIMFDNDSEAWLSLASIHFGRRQYHTDHATCELKFAWHYSTAEQTELRSRICNPRLMEAGGIALNSFEGIDLKLNSLDYLWSIMPASWMAIYRAHFKENFNNELQAVSSQKTERRLRSDNMLLSHYGFNEEIKAWLALTRHFQWQSQPFYLFYANNELNKLPIVKDLLENMMTRCGYDVRFLDWDTFNDPIPDNAVVGVLTDMALFHPSRKENRAYQAVQQHTGKKLLIPWQLPIPDNNTFWNVYWNALPDDWKGDWIHIKTSLFDDLLACLLGRHGMLPHLFPQITEPTFSPLVLYLQQRMIEGKRFNDLDTDSQNRHLEILSVLYQPQNLLAPPAEEEIFDFLEHDLPKISLTLAKYLTCDDKGKFFFSFNEKVKISNTLELAKAIKCLPLSNRSNNRLYQLAIKIVEIFKESSRNSIISESMIRELAFLCHSTDTTLIKEIVEALRRLLKKDDYIQTTKIIEILRGLTIALNYADQSTLKINDLTKILDKLMNSLKESHNQNDEEELFYAILRLIVVILITMQEKGAQSLSRKKFEAQYLDQLKELKSWVSPGLQPVIDESIDLLFTLPKDESDFGKACRQAGYGISLLSNFSHILLSRNITLECIQHIYQDFSDVTRPCIKLFCQAYQEVEQFRKMILNLQSNTEYENALQNCTTYLQQVFTNKSRDDNFILGFLQVIDMFIRDQQASEIQAAAVGLIRQLFEHADLWNRYEPRMAEYTLTYLKVYSETENSACFMVVKEAKEALKVLQQTKHPPPSRPICERLSISLSSSFSSLFTRSFLKKRDEVFLVPPLDTLPDIDNRLFERAKSALNWQHSIILSKSLDAIFTPAINVAATSSSTTVAAPPEGRSRRSCIIL